MPKSPLFQKGTIGSLTLKNRIVMAPMVRNYAQEDGKVTKQLEDHIAVIAKGGTGMLILEASHISPEGKGFVHELGVHSDAMIPGLKKLVRIAHAEGAAIGIQLIHAGRQTSKRVTQQRPLAPSAIPCPTMQEMPIVLSQKEIARIVRAFGDAALRAKKAGMDFVEIHGAHGYLITQFLSPYSNKRTDAYGGSFQKRLRFLEEVIASVRESVGGAFPVTVRLSGDEYVQDGLRISDTKKIAKRLEELGVDALHISSGNYGSYAKGTIIPPMAIPDAPLLPFAKEIKRVVQIPVIAVAKLGDPSVAERAISSGSADFVAIGRSLLADPEWPNKVKAGKRSLINRCITCNQGCISRLFAQQDVRCTVNPACGREAMFAVTSKKRLRIAIIGGGPAGLSAARTAAEHGHTVTLYERSNRLGGQLWAAGAAPKREGWNVLCEKLLADIKRLRVIVHLNTIVTRKTIDCDAFDRIIVATGSRMTPLSLPTDEDARVYTVRHVLNRPQLLKGSVVVIGGGCSGAQTAEFAAVRKHPVTIIEMSTDIAKGAPIDDRALLLERLKKQRVRILTNARAEHFGSNVVTVQTPEGKKTIKANTILVCTGSQSNNELAMDLKALCKDVVVVGDANAPRFVTEAMAEGALAVLRNL